mmetsp:Transcript_27154/g.46653  ORF Transcript_27154/g.46653 Transcript_27154/m.46653 type:complete len:84 (-) Transcript_27154:48-299(-)
MMSKQQQKARRRVLVILAAAGGSSLRLTIIIMVVGSQAPSSSTNWNHSSDHQLWLLVSITCNLKRGAIRKAIAFDAVVSAPSG